MHASTKAGMLKKETNTHMHTRSRAIEAGRNITTNTNMNLHQISMPRALCTNLCTNACMNASVYFSMSVCMCMCLRM